MNSHIKELIEKMNADEPIEFYGQKLFIQFYEFDQWPGGGTFEFNLENGSKIVINSSYAYETKS